MFWAIEQLVRNAKALTIDVIMLGVYTDDEEEIADLIVTFNTEQLFEGIDSNDTKLSDIGGSYSLATVEIKRRKGQKVDRVTLKDTGDFYKSFNVTIEKDGLVINADTIKDDIDLAEEWGEDIIGLNDMSQEALVFFLTPLVREFVLMQLMKDV